MFKKIKRYIAHKRTQKQLKKLRLKKYYTDLRDGLNKALYAYFGLTEGGVNNEEENQ